MKKFIVSVTVCLVLCASHAFASFGAEYDPKGFLPLVKKGALQEFFRNLEDVFENSLFNHVSFDLDEEDFDPDRSHAFRFTWQTSLFSGDLEPLNSGSFSWIGSFSDLLSGEKEPSLIIGEKQVALKGVHPGTESGSVLPADIGGSVDMDFVEPAEAPVSAVPVPAAVWLFGSGLAGLVGIRRRTGR